MHGSGLASANFEKQGVCKEFELVTRKSFFPSLMWDKTSKEKNGWELSWIPTCDWRCVTVLELHWKKKTWCVLELSYHDTWDICLFLQEKKKKKQESSKLWLIRSLMTFSHHKVFICLQITFLYLQSCDQNI